ncbi:hypothetical protein EDB85DRAFT_961351 [Lactarius pseudohatsudake]|nr:hypothetical protein EDB85DRAFT_961351 [Lactarius pseudohatsudake]
MERSSTIFAISSHFYDSSYNRGHYHRAAAGTPAAPNSRKRHAATPAYTWIVEQELAALSREISETRQWVFEQQVHFGLLPKGTGASTQPPPRMRTGEKRRRDPDPAFAGRELDEEMAWLRERLRAAQRDAERSQLQEEFDRMEARWRREEGRQRRRECHRAGEQRGREERQNQAAVERRRQAEAWKAYERQWAAIAIGKDDSPLTFRSVPWPMSLPPRSAREVTSEAVAKFILSHAHSEGVSRKDRIKSALRRWHPDRFGRILNRVDVKDRAAVERAVGTVARCLNDLLAREN